ncbi:MAG TPA: hypothetical protein VNT53_03610 [Pseudolysinimonas sp.]|nr:hypothetical protein [Pseudolysinimonas sp.]
MDWLIFAGVVAVLIVATLVAHRLGWIDLSNKNAKAHRGGGGGGGLVGIGDEVFHPTRYEAQQEMDRQTILPAPAPIPGDGDQDIYTGNVRIDMTRSGSSRIRGRAKHAAPPPE